jgi:hypothetical protein
MGSGIVKNLINSGKEKSYLFFLWTAAVLASGVVRPFR